MASGNKVAQQGEHSALGFSQGLQGNAQGINATLTPELENMAAHPEGFAPTDLAAMNTSAQQSAGGSQAGAVGQGALLASRTRNAGTADAAIGESSRHASEALSDAALKTQIENAQLKNQQQQNAFRGMEGLYGTDVSGANSALGEIASNANANSEAENSALGNQLLKQTLGNVSYSKGGGLGFGG